jgi:hypothetical protein
MKLLLALTATISAGKNSERKRNNALAQELFKENIVEEYWFTKLFTYINILWLVFGPHVCVYR